MIELLVSYDLHILEFISSDEGDSPVDSEKLTLLDIISDADFSYLKKIVHNMVTGQGFGVLNLKSLSRPDVNFQLSFFPNRQSFLFQLVSGQDIILGDNPIDRQYQFIFEHAVMGIYQSTPGGRHVVVNPALASIYGYDSPQELIHEVHDIGLQLFFSPERRLEFLKRLEEKGYCLHFESKIKRKDGKCAWISENARTIKDERGGIQYIIGTVMDITHQKELEFSLREIKNDWQKTFDSIDELIILLDADLKIRRMNAAAKKYLSTTQNISLEGEFTCYSILHCHDVFCNNCPIQKTKADSQIHQTEFEQKNSGRSFQVRSLPQLDERGTLTGIIYVGRDITEEKRFKQEADQRLQQLFLNDKLKSLGEMAAGMAHEINNPLSTLLYNHELMKDSLTYIKNFLPEVTPHSLLAQHVSEMDESVESIQRASDRIKSIINNVKDFTRGDSGTDLEALNLDDLVKRGLLMTRALLKQKFSRVLTNVEPIRVYGHLHKLEQIFYNLVMNSSLAVGDNQGPTLLSVFSASPFPHTALLVFEDNGCGIPPDKLHRISEPFFSSWREQGGTGLGLSIVFEIVKFHGGALQFISQVNRGTRIIIFLRKEKNRSIDRIQTVAIVGKRPHAENIIPANPLPLPADIPKISDFLKGNPQISCIFICQDTSFIHKELLERILEENPLVLFITLTNMDVDPKFQGQIMTWQQATENPEIIKQRSVLWQF